MKKFMMKYLMVSCKEATFLMSKKEEGKLTLWERVKLSMHTTACSLCKRFEKQASQIGQESKNVHSLEILPTLSKQRIAEMLDKK